MRCLLELGGDLDPVPPLVPQGFDGPLVSSHAMSLVPAPELLRRLGAIPAQDVVRHLIDVCEAVGSSGRVVSIDSLLISESPAERAQVTLAPLPHPLPASQGEGVRAIASVGYELLKGMPPPANATESDWMGERPELVAILAPALAGQGDVATLLHQLRTLARPQTANLQPIADTAMSNKLPAGMPSERAGEILGAYELIRRLGSGGMGDVYLARHVRLGREVAVKILKPEFASQADIVQRFFQEAKVVNEINHPHIVEIHDFVEEPGRAVYCVMELLQGQSLVELLDSQKGSLPVMRVAKLFAQVCDALEAAHRRGVVHRDVKPDNIFVTQAADGNDFVRVLDFGIARRLTPGHSRTEVGAVLGTPYYMAPEQAAGRPVDARADVYSVGVAMFEALSGSAPQDAGNPRPLLRTKKGEDMPDEFVVLLQRCLALDPSKRPSTAAQVRASLLEISGAPTAPRPTTDAIENAAGLGKATGSRTAMIALGFVVTLGILGFVLRPTIPAGESVPPPVATKEPVTPPPAAPAETLKQPPPAEVAVISPMVKKRPLPVKKLAPAPAAPVNPFAGRAETVRRRYDELVARFGQSQLTSLEKAAVAQALDDYRLDRQSDLAVSLNSAEAALDAADRRLSR